MKKTYILCERIYDFLYPLAVFSTQKKAIEYIKERYPNDSSRITIRQVPHNPKDFVWDSDVKEVKITE